VAKKFLEEGLLKGRQDGEVRLILHLLEHRFGKLSPEVETQIQTLPLTQLEELGKVLLYLGSPSDLLDWIQSHV
jgi:hypothetical protein